MSKPPSIERRNGQTYLNGKRVWWPTNRDATGALTFALPGETTLSSATMRERTDEYYRQVRGGQRREDQRAGFRALAEAKALLSEEDQTTKRPHAPGSDTKPAPNPYRNRK